MKVNGSTKVVALCDPRKCQVPLHDPQRARRNDKCAILRRKTRTHGSSRSGGILSGKKALSERRPYLRGKVNPQRKIRSAATFFGGRRQPDERRGTIKKQVSNAKRTELANP
jgi:hypothetical protein